VQRDVQFLEPDAVTNHRPSRSSPTHFQPRFEPSGDGEKSKDRAREE